jgi:hypothetical protein
MRYVRLLPLAALALAVACSDTATDPTSVERPLFSIGAGFFGDADALTTNTPGGGHLQGGAIGCTVNADLSISCSAYEVAGVGNTNADVSLVATYSADVKCNNPAGGKNRNNDIEPHATTFDVSQNFTVTSSKNGRMRVSAASAGPGSASTTGLCPNGNWIPEITNLTLDSFSYTLTFAGFSSPAVSIAAP